MTRSAWSGGLAFPIIQIVWIAAACDAQMEPGYQGDVLVALTGQASADEPLPDELRFEVRWIDFVARDSCAEFLEEQPYGAPPFIASPELELEAGEEGEEGHELPNPFTLSVLDGPERWMNDFTRAGRYPHESRIALGEIDGQAHDWPHQVHWSARLRQVLIYVESDIAPGTASETFAGGRLAAGWHLMDTADAPCDSYLGAGDPSDGSLDCLRPAPLDLETVLSFRFHRAGDAAPGDPPHLYKTPCDCDPGQCFP